MIVVVLQCIHVEKTNYMLALHEQEDQKSDCARCPRAEWGCNEVSRYREPIDVRSPLRSRNFYFPSDSHVYVGSPFSCVQFSPIKPIFPLLFAVLFES